MSPSVNSLLPCHTEWRIIERKIKCCNLILIIQKHKTINYQIHIAYNYCMTVNIGGFFFTLWLHKTFSQNFGKKICLLGIEIKYCSSSNSKSAQPSLLIHMYREKAYLLPTWVWKITCQCFDWILQSFPWWQLEHLVEMSASYFPISSWYQITYMQQPTEKPLHERCTACSNLVWWRSMYIRIPVINCNWVL